MTFKRRLLRRHKLSTSIAAGAAALAVAVGGGYAIESSGASSTATAVAATTSSTTAATGAHSGSGGGGSNARSGPAAGGSIGKVSSVSASGFGLLTSAGQKVTVKETSSTTYEKGSKSASASAVAKGKTALVTGTTNSTTITATQVIVSPTNSGPKASSKVVPFKSGAPSTSKKVGQIPVDLQARVRNDRQRHHSDQGHEGRLAAYPGGIVDRVVQLSTGEYEVHYIGVNWPHHIFVSKSFKVVGAF